VRDDRLRLADILDAIAAIRRHTDAGRTAFDGDELVRVWLVHHLQIIGEATARLDPALRDRALRLVGLESPSSDCASRSGSISVPVATLRLL
jgi:uncharacterized protein with HEPN domain